MYCIACGAQNSDQDKYCARCGKPLVAGAAGQIAATAIAAPVMPSTAYRQGTGWSSPKARRCPATA